MKELKTAALSFRVPESLKKALEELAEADERSMADYLLRVLRAHLKEKGKLP